MIAAEILLCHSSADLLGPNPHVPTWSTIHLPSPTGILCQNPGVLWHTPRLVQHTCRNDQPSSPGHEWHAWKQGWKYVIWGEV